VNAPLDVPKADAPEIPAGLRLLGLGLKRMRGAALGLLSRLLDIPAVTSSHFSRLGIHGDGVIPDAAHFDALHVDDVTFPGPGGRFDSFARGSRGTRSVAGVIIPARDECGDLIDSRRWNVDDASSPYGAAWRDAWRGLTAPAHESEALAGLQPTLPLGFARGAAGP